MCVGTFLILNEASHHAGMFFSIYFQVQGRQKFGFQQGFGFAK